MLPPVQHDTQPQLFKTKIMHKIEHGRQPCVQKTLAQPRFQVHPPPRPTMRTPDVPD